MDSWKQLSDGRGVWLSEELGFPGDDGHGRFNCKEEIGYEIKPFSNIGGSSLVSNTQALEKLDFMELGFSDEFRKSYLISTDPSGDVFSGEISTDSCGNLVSPFCEERESGSRFSTDFMQSNNQDLSLMDLNLGRLADGGGALASEPSPSSVSSLTGKRTRSTTLYPRSTCCQVLGCNKDLSSFKGYYKRHKVCDVHTKTAKVIVDGIEQRFCQQCSRFHLLAEFDDGKRSCRRRLAAHNKRRRKPQLNSQLGERMDHLFPAYVKGKTIAIGNLNVENLPDIGQTSRALSLLSSPSYNTQYGTAISELSSHADSYAVNHSSGFFRKITESGNHKPGIYQMEGDQVDPSTINPRDGSIILDLLQLSSHFQRIEHQRDSTELKLDRK